MCIRDRVIFFDDQLNLIGDTDTLDLDPRSFSTRLDRIEFEILDNEEIEQTIEEKNWKPDPFNGLKILKGEMEYYYDADPEIQKSEEKIQYLKTIIETVHEIVNNLNWRHQTIGNMIKWRQFEAGG